MSNSDELDVEEKKEIKCEICGDFSDGNHYDIQACRSCTAFFRRTVSFKKKYSCNGGNNCIIDYQNRNACKSCRFKKCLSKGMNVSFVQPRREPTGAQPNRKNRRVSLQNPIMNTLIQTEGNSSSNSLIDSRLNEEIDSNSTTVERNSMSKMEDNFNMTKDSDDNNSMNCSGNVFSELIKFFTVSERINLTTVFKEYVRRYIEIRESLKLLHFTDPIDIINNSFDNLPLRVYTPRDMLLLARSDLTGVTLWISEIEEYSKFTNLEKASLLQRFALRKIMLDHCYMTSKYKEHFEKGNLVMPNYTYIPSDKTGYEKENDSLYTNEIIYNIFRETLNYAIKCVVKPMNELNLTEEEIVFLYLLILWNKNNEKYVSSDKRHIFTSQKNWALKCLFIHYSEKKLLSPEIRFGEITLLLKELEACCLLHCEDYMTSKFFNINFLKEMWYDNVCYSCVNFEV
ncbi:Transcription factor HNF-4 homolog [Strongyloides ratti]|uniref:Transcription factor HNF-4 homolog n=1 Tax=Strongyloides ratti TaxID=34506 RepID=A0A090L769_STRRB|nr:Transcription factor HNF-4 homolog [Strongyloides ratti]CEF63973.1 Transcription factor HNF-4 homolog [Strongyloides ratti]